MLLLYHVRQEFARKILRNLPAIVSCRLRYSLAEHELDDVDPPLHDKRQDDSIADFALPRLCLALLFSRCAEAVDGILSDRHDLAQNRARDMLLDVLCHVIDMQCVYDIVSYICPFAHDYSSSSKLMVFKA